MNLFFASLGEDELAVLNEEESFHCVRVLRMKEGDEIRFVDGTGGYFTGNISIADSKQCVVKVTERRTEYGKRIYRLHVAIAPTKNLDRFEWFLEKATEIGVDEITPVICERSERKVVKTDRLKRILVSAMKQSLKAYLPILHEPQPLPALLAQENSGNKFLCTLDAAGSLKDLYRKNESAIILIGPEGDFSGSEIQSAAAHGFQSVSLGTSRLRTETAGVVACTIVSLLN